MTIAAYCECGCGERTAMCFKSSTAKGHVKGQPLRFASGHNSRRKKDPGGGLVLCAVCAKALPPSSFHAQASAPNGRQSWCKDCTRADRRQWRRDNRELSRERVKDWHDRHPGYRTAKAKEHAAKNPEKAKARRVLEDAVRRGRIVKPTICEDCGGDYALIHGHHEDYSNPLEVVWLCPQCHTDRHHGGS